MNIIVDAYNVLKGVLGGGFIGQHERSRFLQQLGLYARKKSHHITVVFDGGEFVYPFCEEVHGITACYSGKELSADNFIRKIIKETVHKDQLLVVSSDREVVRCARQSAVNTIKADEFYLVVLDTLQTAAPAVSSQSSAVTKTTEDTNEELDALMRGDRGRAYIKTEDIELQRGRSVQRRSKHERQMARLIKKL